MLDSSGVHVLSELATILERRHITVLVKGLQDQHRRLMDRGGVTSSMSPEHIFNSLPDAIEHAREHVLIDLAEKEERDRR